MNLTGIMKRKLIIAVFVSACFLCACGGSSKEQIAEENSTAIEMVEIEPSELPENERDRMLPINETKDGIVIDDILECRHFIGKTAEEAGIPDDVIKKESYGLPQVYADGQIFGSKDYGIVYFAKDSDGNTGAIDSLWIHVKETGFEKCQEELQKLFGDPVSEGEEPYVEANGGAVMWADFIDGEYDIRLSNGSEREYCEISISLKSSDENKDYEEESTAMTDNIEVFTQNSIRIRNRKGTIYIDPFQMNETPNDADYLFITHEHYDHYSPDDIKKVAGDNTVLVIPESMQDKISDISGQMRRIVTVKPGMFYEVDGLEFDTVAAYNTLKNYHPKSAEWVGYILRLDDKRIYIAGDTDATKEAKAVKCDIALVPIGGTFTMNAKQAAGLINDIRPEFAIPTHYGSVVGSPEDAEVFKENVKEPVKVEIKIDL